jgi:predicted nucleic acid-binding protein
MNGLDTGFFVRLLQGHQRARNLWQDLGQGQEQGAFSCLTVFELERLALQGKLDRQRTDVLLAALPNVCTIVWLNTSSVVLRAARIAHGTGLPAVDALILAGLLAAGAQTVYTTDDWSTYHERGVQIVQI